jgi:hypothetical protein
MTDDKPIEEPEDQAQEETEPDEPAADELVEEAAAEEAGAEEAADEPVEEVDVLDLARMTIGIFVQEAWIGMGVQARQGTAETRVDLQNARIAISMVEAIGGKLADDALEDEQRTIENLLTDLRVNYLRVSSKPEE